MFILRHGTREDKLLLMSDEEIIFFVEFLKDQYGKGRPDYIEALNDLDGLVEASYKQCIERFFADEI